MNGYFVWDVSPVIINGLPFRWYGLLFALGFIVSYQILDWIFKREHESQKALEKLTIYMVLATVIGARLGHCLFYDPAYYLSNPVEILKVWEGGLASHGAGIGIVVGILLFVWKTRSVKLFWIFDRIAIVVPFAAMCVRIGNFINSEILGAPANVPWAVIFAKEDMLPRHPVQIYEAITYLILFASMILLYTKTNVKDRKGFLSGVFLVVLFTARFFIEYFKEVQEKFDPFLLHMGQWLSVPFILAGIIFIIYSLRSHEKKEIQKS